MRAYKTLNISREKSDTKTPFKKTLTCTSREVREGNSSHYFFPSILFSIPDNFGNNIMSYIPPVIVNALNFLFLPGRIPSIHNHSTIKSISQYRSLESKLLSYG